MTEWSKISPDPTFVPAPHAAPSVPPAQPAAALELRERASRGCVPHPEPHRVAGADDPRPPLLLPRRPVGRRRQRPAAVLASAGTVGLLGATRAPAPAAATGSAAAIDPAERRAGQDHHRRRPAERRRGRQGVGRHDHRRRHGDRRDVDVQHPHDRRRIRRDPDRGRLHPHEPPRRQGQPVAERRPQRRHRVPAPRSSRSPTTTTSP